MEDILIPLGFFTACVLIVYFAIKARLARNQMEHEERMLALEKGVDIPLTPRHAVELSVLSNLQAKVRNPFFWPLVLVAIGVAMFIGMILEGEWDSAGWAAMPLLIGVGMLVANRIYGKKKEPESPQ